MKQIEIYDLLPLMKPGFVAMDKDGAWWWFIKEPVLDLYTDGWEVIRFPMCECSPLEAFDIAAFAGDWKDSLMECGK